MTIVLGIRFAVQTGLDLVLRTTWSTEPRTGPVAGPMNLNQTEPELLVRFRGSRFEPRFRTELRQHYTGRKRGYMTGHIWFSDLVANNQA
jgi:hypothetical protein